MVNNLYNKIHIIFEDINIGDSYVIYRKEYGCIIKNPVASGIINSDYQAILKLPDGQYVIFRVGDEDEELECFSVYYNMLPTLIPRIQNILCPCDQCDTYSEDELFSLCFYILGISTSTGLCQFNNKFFTDFKKLTDQEDEIKKYYNKKSIDYIKKYIDYIAYFYIYLYSLIVDNINTTDADLDEMNYLFQIDEMEMCLFNLGYSFDNTCKPKKCDCDE